MTCLKFGRVHVYKNVLSDFKIQENGGEEILAFRARLMEFMSLLFTFNEQFGTNSA